MQSNLFNPETINGSGGFYWWTGIIVSDDTWNRNVVSEKWSDVSNLPGWGARYKVRIVGKHTEVRNKLSDDDLEMCEVLYPVTAGSGHAASYQSSNLRQGSVVLGFYKDGIDGNDPIILGCIGNNEQTSLSQRQQKGFDPLSAFTNEFSVPLFSTVPGGSPPKKNPDGSITCEANTDSTCNRTTLQDQEEVDEENSSLAVPETCDKVHLSAIQLRIKNLIKDIERVKKQANDWRQVVTDGIQNVEQFIDNAVENASKFISGGIKWIITEIQKKVTDRVNNAAKNLYYALFPNERPGLKRTMETVNDLIACLFRKIIGNLIKMVAKFLLQAVDRFINTPLCAVENMVGALLGKITGLITSALDAIIAPVNALLGIIDLAGDVIGFLVDILTFLSCDESANCPEVKEWNIWDGASNVPKFDFNSLINKAKSFASSVTQSVNPNNFNFDLDFSDVFADSCNVGAVLCGPPTVEFFGGGGSGATGNAIISAAGEILGVDILSSGSGYSSAPLVRFVDACGNGKGAIGRVVIGNINGKDSNDLNNIGVVGVIMEDTGTGYFSSPDGSLGGDGRTWAEKYETTVKRRDGRYDRPYVPGELINLFPGDFVRIPTGTTIETDGNIINGGNYIEINNQITISAPPQDTSESLSGDYPSLDDGKYPVVLNLKDIIIDNSGFNYSENDVVVIEPSNGASAIPKFGAFGALESIKLTSSGEGFKEVPRVYIQSNTGYNSKLIPVFDIDRVSVDKLKEPGVQDEIISVVDCVGKIPNVNFFRVPR
jgi:hypothetical protein